MQFFQSIRKRTALPMNWSMVSQWQCRCAMIILVVRPQHCEVLHGVQLFSMVFVLLLLLLLRAVLLIGEVFVALVVDDRFEDSPRISWPRAADSTVPAGPRRTASRQMMLSRHVAIISAYKFERESLERELVDFVMWWGNNVVYLIILEDKSARFNEMMR